MLAQGSVFLDDRIQLISCGHWFHASPWIVGGVASQVGTKAPGRADSDTAAMGAS